MTNIQTRTGLKASSAEGGMLFKTCNELLKQKQTLEQQSIIIDQQILEVQEYLYKNFEGKAYKTLPKTKVAPKQKVAPEEEIKFNEVIDVPPKKVRKKYVSRMNNHNTLLEAIHAVMIPGQKMNMQEILSLLKKNKKYKTKSDGLYTMVNNKLCFDKENIERVSHGVYVFKGIKE